MINAYYLVREPLHQNGHQEVEEDIVAKSHESYKIESCPVSGSLHPSKQHNIPVLLGKHLQYLFIQMKQQDKIKLTKYKLLLKSCHS